jgi:hypothetical protein
MLHAGDRALTELKALEQEISIATVSTKRG